MIMERGLNTRCLHLEETEGKTEHYGALSYPIYQTATYAHPGAGKSTGYDYSRLQNPTREHLEKTVASLEGGIDAFALSTGMAAITLLMEIFGKFRPAPQWKNGCRNGRLVRPEDRRLSYVQMI